MNRQSHKISPWLIIIASITTLWGHAQEQFVTPKEAPLVTPWGETVNEQQVHNEYPRPLLQRNQWINLNGRWEFQEAKEGDQLAGANQSSELLAPPPKVDPHIIDSLHFEIPPDIAVDASNWREFQLPQVPLPNDNEIEEEIALQQRRRTEIICQRA